MVIRIFLGVLFVASLRADEVAMIHYGESWQFFRGTNEPSSPVTAWRQVNFDDSLWESGIAGFGTTGDEGTTFPASPLYRSAYFRKVFTIGDVASIKWLVLRVDYASGFVAYLNGQEVARRGLAGNPVAFNIYATNRARGVAEDFNLGAFIPTLTSGTNVLAIQLHRGGANSFL